MARKSGSSEEKSLLAGICSSPEDDAPRLVYADWLEEHDQPERAELIRVEVRIAQLPIDSPERRPLVWRARELLYHHGNTFDKQLPRTVQQFTCRYRRGFIASLHGTAARFIKDGATLFRHIPLERAELFNHEERLADLAATPVLAQLRELRLDRNENANAIDLLDSPHLDRLTHLDLCYAALSVADAKELRRKKALAQLTYLRPGRVDAPGMRALMRSPHLTNLTSLDVQNNILGPGGIRALTEADQLTRLTRLNLNYSSPELEGIELLASWSKMAHLTSLNLGSCFLGDVGDEGLRRLAQHCPMPRLQVLDLSNNRLTAAGVEELLTWPGLDNVTDLDLSSNDIGADALATLLRSPRFNRLTQLSTLSIGDPPAVAKAVLDTPGLDRLHSLDADFGLTDDNEVTQALHARFTRWAFFGALWPFRGTLA